jgi:hypothetical protein
MLAIWTVVMVLIGIIGLFAGGWWFVIGTLVGVLALGSLAATSDRVRLWFVDLDDMIDDEALKEQINRRWNGEVKLDPNTTIKVVTQ